MLKYKVYCIQVFISFLQTWSFDDTLSKLGSFKDNSSSSYSFFNKTKLVKNFTSFFDLFSKFYGKLFSPLYITSYV